MVRHFPGERRPKHCSYDGMNEPPADSYLQRFRECRLDPIGNPLIAGIPEPSPYSSGFSTGQVVAKALGWQQELAARVREIQERPGIPLDQRTEAANFLVNLAAEAALAIETLCSAFPEVFKTVARKRGTFPVNLSVLKEDNDRIQGWLETLELGSEHELKLKGRKTFSRRTFANDLLIRYMGQIKASAVQLSHLRIQNPVEFANLERSVAEKLTFHTPLSKATAKEWMKVIWKLLLADYPAPERDKRLKQFGIHKARKTRIMLGKSLPRSEGASVRAGIRDALLSICTEFRTNKARIWGGSILAHSNVIFCP
jgi:hypothetical protein